MLEVPIRATEYQANSPDDDELRSPYLVDNTVDVSGWARDAVVLALPEKILCRADCAGLCPVCGKNLNDEPHEHEETAADPRWAALEALRDERLATLRLPPHGRPEKENLEVPPRQAQGDAQRSRLRG